jgi:hypothetical protein
MTTLGGQDRAERNRNPEREGEPAGEQADRRRGCEPEDPEPRSIAKALIGDRGEEQGGDERRQHAHQSRSDQRPERRQQQAVAGQVMTAEPEVVPGREPLIGEQARAKDLRGMVGAVRLDDQVRPA